VGSFILRLIPVLALVLASACSGAPAAPPAGPHAPLARGEGAGIKVVLGVEAVDVEKRQITLRGPAGRKGTFPVSPEVRRLSELKAGDTILCEYSVVAVAELRDPTPEEAAAPLVLAEMIDRRPANLPPGGTIARTIRMVTKIAGLNGTAGTVTLDGPLDGQILTKVEEPSIMVQLRVGQQIVVKFDETLVLSVEPATQKQ